MNCNNINCKKNVSNYNICENCSSIYCSISCLNIHKQDFHRNSILNNMDNIVQPRKSMSRSIFLKSGIYWKEIIDDPQLEFSNFDFVKTNDKKKILGSGAFGEVYLATNKLDKNFYAIKVMEKQKIIDSGASLDIIRREIDIHRRINHENIVKVHTHFENDKYFYLIMEYVNGGSLFTIIKKSKGIDEKKAFRYFIQACSAVNFLHQNDLIHRDLKPENILINDKGIVKLCDFGWCVDVKLGNRMTFCGTYEYMAPEVVKEKPYEFGIDVWSLGILLYELTHGYSPFRAEHEDGDDFNEIFTNIIRYKFKIEKDMSNGCIDLIQRLLTPDNKKRIKIREIFLHPWVIEMEGEVKEEIRKNSETTITSHSTNATDSNKVLTKGQSQPFILNQKTPQNNSFSLENLKQEIKNETLRLKLEKKKQQQQQDPNDVSGILDKFNNTKGKLNKNKTSKDKIKKLENKLKSEKIIKKDNSRISLNKNDLNIQTIEKKNNIQNTKENKINFEINNEKSSLNENNLILHSERLNDYSDYSAARNETMKTIIEDTNRNKNNIISEEKTKILHNFSILETNNNYKINNDNQSASKLKKEETNKKNKIKCENIINDANKYDDIFNLDVYDEDAKNTLNVFSDNKRRIENRSLFEISPEINKNVENLKQIKYNKPKSFNIYENQDLNNITNLKNFKGEGQNNEINFDMVLTNVKKKNRDKHIKNNKSIDKLLNSVNAHLAYSKNFNPMETNNEEIKNNGDMNYKNILNSSNNFNNLFISNNSEIFFENIIKNPIEGNFNDNSKLFEESNEYLVSNKQKKSSLNTELQPINEVVKKKIIKIKSKNKAKCNLDNENSIRCSQKYDSKSKQTEEKLLINLEKSSDEEKLNKGKQRKDFDYEDEIFSIPNKNKKNNKKSLPIPALVLKNNLENNLKKDTKIKRNSDLLKKKNGGKEYIIGQAEIKDLDRQLNLDFLPKDLLYNDMTFEESNKRMLESLEILEQAKLQKLKEKENNYETKEEELGFWDKFTNLLNPFKCANYGNPN